MNRYDVSKEIYNPCADMYTFDINFCLEVETDDIENTLCQWMGGNMPKFDKITFDDGSVEIILDLPRKIRYTFSII